MLVGVRDLKIGTADDGGAAHRIVETDGQTRTDKKRAEIHRKKSGSGQGEMVKFGGKRKGLWRIAEPVGQCIDFIQRCGVGRVRFLDTAHVR